MEFKPGDKVRRRSHSQYGDSSMGWPWGGEVREVLRMEGRSVVLKDCGEHYSSWDACKFDLDIGPNAAQLAATAKFDGQPQPTPAETVKLKGDLRKVYDTLKLGDIWTLKALSVRTGVSELSVGSRVRDLRKPKFGGHTITRLKQAGLNSHIYKMEIV